MRFVLAFALAILPLQGRSGTRTPVFNLGGHSVGEKLSDFRGTFPEAICGSKAHAALVLLGSDYLDASAVFGCCLNSSSDVATFSPHRILLINYCRVFVVFYNERLQDVSYFLDVPDIAGVLPEFEKSFGPVAIDNQPRLGQQHSTRVAWAEGHDVLELSTVILDDCPDKIVRVHLWNIHN